MIKPMRVQLRRARGWRMPANTVKVDRSTPWGNPFVTGTHGTQGQCVLWFMRLCAGLLTISVDAACVKRQYAFLDYAKAHRGDLKGKNLACWCRAGTPCHADVLLEVAAR